MRLYPGGTEGVFIVRLVLTRFSRFGRQLACAPVYNFLKPCPGQQIPLLAQPRAEMRTHFIQQGAQLLKRKAAPQRPSTHERRSPQDSAPTGGLPPEAKSPKRRRVSSTRSSPSRSIQTSPTRAASPGRTVWELFFHLLRHATPGHHLHGADDRADLGKRARMGSPLFSSSRSPAGPSHACPSRNIYNP